jgi:hypothetical protein
MALFEEGVTKIPGFENTTEMGPPIGLRVSFQSLTKVFISYKALAVL